jgi:hypothetical protein
MKWISALGRGLCGVVVLVCGLSACGSTRPAGTSAQRYLDTSRVALAIERSTLSQRGLHAYAYCPSEVPQIKGQSFTCIAYAARVAPATFTVVQLDARGHVRYVAH